MAGGLTKGSWKPGQSGNPAGRPRGFDARARELVDFDAMTLAMADIVLGMLVPKLDAQDKPVLDETGKPVMHRVVTAEDKDRIAAYKILCERAHGKPREKVDVTHHDVSNEIDWSKVDEQTGRDLERALTKVLTEPDVVDEHVH